jgi:protein involved in polysaccharide export with SLBB domain
VYYGWVNRLAATGDFDLHNAQGAEKDPKEVWKRGLEMTRSNTTALLMAIVVTCAFASAQVAQDAQTDSSAQVARADLPQTGSTDTQFTQRDQRYRLRKSDVIDVKFTFSPELNQTITVQPDGYIALDGADAIHVENKTLAELTESIRRAYSGILHEPVITVSLKDFDKPFFLAAGQVGKPGKYELRSDTTLTEAVAIAGGFTDASKHSQVVLFRRVSNDMVEAKVFNAKQMLGSRNLQEDPHLVPGDMLYVPQNTISKVRRYLPTSSMGAYVTPNPF